MRDAGGIEYQPLSCRDFARDTNRQCGQQCTGRRVGNPVGNALCQPRAQAVYAWSGLGQTLVEGPFDQARLGCDTITQQQAPFARIARWVEAQCVLPRLTGRGAVQSVRHPARR
jgi:hypothetical protein